MINILEPLCKQIVPQSKTFFFKNKGKGFVFLSTSSSRHCGESGPYGIQGFEKYNIPLYENHIHTSYFQKVALTIGASVTSLMDPRRHDMIAVLGETTGYYALSNIYEAMLKDTEAVEILAEKPRINSKTVDLEKLSKLPQNTLGYTYYKFLNVNQVTPDSRLPVRFVDNVELAYVIQRYREVHDLFHTVLDMPTNMQGEVAVKWVEALQLRLPMCICAAMFGPIRFKPKQRKNYLQSYLSWAFHTGRNAKPLINIYFEKRWEQDIAELRKELNIEPYSSWHTAHT